jgi:DNA replication and repair protein RecF
VNFKSVELVHFRNFNSLRLDLNPGINVFTGSNGQGKTNLIESLYFLSRGHSFRTSHPEHMIQECAGHSTGSAHVRAVFTKNRADNQAEAHLVDSKKSILVNNKKVSPTQLVQLLPCILFSPESLLAIKEGPHLRRELVDEMVVTMNTSNLRVILDFQKALRHRNQVLKRAEERPQDLTLLLSTINDVYLEKAVELTKLRIECLSKINPHVSEIMKTLTGDITNETRVDYVISDLSASEWNDAQIHDAICNRMTQLRDAEIATGLTLVGPHRHDIKVLYGNKDSRYFCSQGQQRALILALKMTQIVQHHRIYGNFPTLFLDDVLSELDSEKRAFLIDFLMGIETQSILTTTDFSLFGELASKLSVFHVKSGTIEV